MTGAKCGEAVAFNHEVALGALEHACKDWRGTSEDVLAYKLEESNSELTLIATVEIEGNIEEFFKFVAKQLKQEAIAYYVVEEQQGYLVGEYAEEWGGEFKPEYFLI